MCECVLFFVFCLYVGFFFLLFFLFFVCVFCDWVWVYVYVYVYVFCIRSELRVFFSQRVYTCVRVCVCVYASVLCVFVWIVGLLVCSVMLKCLLCDVYFFCGVKYLALLCWQE